MPRSSNPVKCYTRFLSLFLVYFRLEQKAKLSHVNEEDFNESKGDEKQHVRGNIFLASRDTFLQERKSRGFSGSISGKASVCNTL